MLRSSSATLPAVLHLVRHGESSWNAAGRVQGQSPHAGSLTAQGRQQAVAVAEQLAERCSTADAVVSSDLDRAAETAAIIAERMDLPVEVDPGLREQHLGRLEGNALAQQLGGFSVTDTVAALWRNPYRRPPGGESVAEMYWRVCATLDRIGGSRQGREVIIVTHGGPVRVVTAALSDAGLAGIRRDPVDNGSITTVRISLPHTLRAAGAA